MRRFAALSMAIAIVMLLTSCSLISRILGPSDEQLVRYKMADIVEALNDQDAAALRAMFTSYARAEYSAEIDEGVAHLLSLFPNGDVIWRDDQPGGGGSGLSDGGGGEMWLSGASYVVSSGGKEYTLSFDLFTYNTIDPDNVGIFRIGVEPWTESGVSGAELASCGSINSETDVREGGPPGVFIGDSGGLSHERAVAIVDALNAQDAAALKSMFTEYARTEYSAQIDEGLEYLLSMFPNGDVTWGEAAGGSAVCERIQGDAKTVLLPTYYTLRTGGVDYRLFFADFTENTIDPDNVGIYAMGAVLAADCGNCVPEAELSSWAYDFYPGTTARPGVLVPATRKADVRMEHIAAALNSHDAAALKAMFSTDVLNKTPEIDRGLDYLLSLFPNGGITWTQDPVVINPVEGFSYVDAGKLEEGVHGNFKISADGHEYWLYFADATVNEANPDAVGLERLGVTPGVWDPRSGISGAAETFYDWITIVVSDPNFEHSDGIYVPQ